MTNEIVSFKGNAYAELASCFSRSAGKAYIRLYVQPYTCMGPVMRMMRDYEGPKENDAVFAFEKFSVILNRSLLEKMEHITFEFDGYSILIHSNLKNVKPGCLHCPYGQEGNCLMTRKSHKNYATWKMAGQAAGN